MRRGRASGVAHGGDSDDDDDQRMAMLRAVAVDGAAILGQFPPGHSFEGDLTQIGEREEFEWHCMCVHVCMCVLRACRRRWYLT